nr:hypothetical protein [Tanacetum cinerariifolium]GEY95736.1 hypothetical protein [Tanacetum cinerariifolium]
MDEPEPHPAYDFLVPGIEADVPLLGELGEMDESLGAKVDKPMVGLVVDELAGPIVEVEELMIAPSDGHGGGLSHAIR